MKSLLIIFVLVLSSFALANDMKLELKCSPYSVNNVALSGAADSIYSKVDSAGLKQLFLMTPSKTPDGFDNYRLLRVLDSTTKYSMYRAEETGVFAVLNPAHTRAYLRSKAGAQAVCTKPQN